MPSVPKRLRAIAVVTAGLSLAGLGAAWLIGKRRHDATEPPIVADSENRGELVAGEIHTMRLHPDDVRALGLKTIEVQQAPPPAPLRFRGALLLDTDYLARVRSRFSGEVVEVGNPEGTATGLPDHSADSGPIVVGARVRANQLLAVVLSKDLGEKKSELADALSRLRLDEDILRRVDEAYRNGAAPERNLRDAERNVAADRIAVERARRTLRTWRVDDDEIKAVEREGERFVRESVAAERKGVNPKWARVEVRAPFLGIILEVNVVKGDIVDSANDLFKIADLSRLRVAAYAPEEEVAVLQQLTPAKRIWSIRFPAEPDVPPLVGSFDAVGLVIDPNQRTAAVTGGIENPETAHGERRLRVGQLLMAEIPLPAPTDEVVIPRAALVYQGQDYSVFVQADSAVPQYARRTVALLRQGRALAHVRGEPNPEEARRGCKPLKPGDRVVTAGVVELAANLSSLTGRPR
jgi:cobalt-zinc-cadmium efflux system membrane fusion protein